jgi:hypothetical protein
LGEDTLTHKRCAYCHSDKPTTDFNKNPKSSDGCFSYCKPCRAEWTKKYDRAEPHKKIFLRKKHKAKERGIEFSLKLEDVVFPTHCPALGVELSYVQRGGNPGSRPNTASFDRIDPSKGYIPGNVIIVSELANRIKTNATVEQIERVAAFYRQLIPHVGATHV